MVRKKRIKTMTEEEKTITTQLKRKKKPHDKFEAVIRFDSTPVEMKVEADKTNLKVKDLRK